MDCRGEKKDASDRSTMTWVLWVKKVRVVDGMCGERFGSGREAREGTPNRKGEESRDQTCRDLVRKRVWMMDN